MRTVISKIRHSFSWLAFFILGISNFSSANELLYADGDSIIKPEKDYRDTITSTFGYHFYQKKLIGESTNIYKNMGAVLDYRTESRGFFNSGLENYFPLLYLFYLPGDSASVSYITYVTGSKDEQIFSAGFVQKIFGNFAINGHYRNVVSPGFYQRQSNKIRNFSTGLAYLSPNRFYRGEINFTQSKLSEQQNGGIVTDTALSGVLNSQGKNLAVNLKDADMGIKRKSFTVINQFNLHKSIIDSAENRSNVFSLGKITQHTEYDRKYFKYYSTSINPEFYQDAYLDSVSTYDSVFISNLHNELCFSFDLGNSGSEINLNYGNELIKYNLHDSKNQFVINQIGAGIIFHAAGFNFTSQLSYKYEQILKSGYFFNVRFEKTTKIVIEKIFVEGMTKSDFPSLIANSYTSNHFIWRNEFQNVKQKKLTAGFLLKNEFAGLSFSTLNIRDYIYYNSNALPVQFDNDINVMSVDLTAKYNFYRNWIFYNESSFQTSDKNEIYVVPDLTAYSSIYYERDYFKKALKASIGIGCMYFTSYYANAYVPATAQFYLQHEQQIGNYPYFDFFANFRIRTAKFFIKVEHFNKGFNEDNYFYLPHQPSPGRTLKVGLNWNFSEGSYK